MKINILIAALTAALITCCACNKPSGKPDDGNITPEEPQACNCMVSFEKNDSKEFFNVAVRDEYKKDIWYVFRINHYKNHDPLEYMDLWRIDWAYRGKFADGKMTVDLDKILTSGESESVFKDYGSGLNTGSHIDTYDFTGGFHGDERIDLQEDCGITFYIDDKALAKTEYVENLDWQECDKFHYVQKSTMHKTASKVDGKAVESDHHVVAEHTKTTTFDNCGYRTENTLIMKDAIDFYWYHGICCIGTCVAAKGCNEDMTPVVTFDQSGPNRLDVTGKCEYRAWNDANAIEVHVKANLTEGGDDSKSRMFIWDTTNYAKFYRRNPANGAYRTKDGECFSSFMDVRFSSR